MTDGGGELMERRRRAEGANSAKEGTKSAGQGMEVGMVLGGCWRRGFGRVRFQPRRENESDRAWGQFRASGREIQSGVRVRLNLRSAVLRSRLRPRQIEFRGAGGLNSVIAAD